MNNRLRITLLILFACIFCLSGYSIISKQLEYKRGNDIYDEAIEMFFIVSEETPVTIHPNTSSSLPASSAGPGPAGELDDAPESPSGLPQYSVPALKMDFPALAEINEDIIGWIIIPDSKVNYPLLKGTDNDYYLNRTYNKVSSPLGSIFMDYRCSSDFSNRHAVIYGHNMKSGSMFGGLSNYASQSYFQSHRYFYIYTADGYLKYEIFSAHKSSIVNPDSSLSLSWDGEAFGKYFSDLSAASEINSGISASDDGKIVTLITCTANERSARFFVHGILIEDARQSGDEEIEAGQLSDSSEEAWEVGEP